MSGKEQKPKPSFEPPLRPAQEDTTKTYPYAPQQAARPSDERAARESSEPASAKPPLRRMSAPPHTEDRATPNPLDSVTTRFDPEDERHPFHKEAEPLESITAPMGKEKSSARAEPPPAGQTRAAQTVTTVFADTARESSRGAMNPPPRFSPPAPPPSPPPPPSLQAPPIDPKQAPTIVAPAPSKPASPRKEETTQPRFTMLTWTPVDRSFYRVEGVVAQGGIGRILRAHDTRLNRTVAVKELLAPKGEAKERFAREVYLTARLEHPSIVPVYEAGRWHDGEPFYAMKLVSGRSMLDVIAQAKSLEERMHLISHVIALAEAMAFAHAKKVIHRDLKPANVMIGEFGETIVIDWGLAKELDETTGQEKPDGDNTIRHKLTNAGAVVGTPAYMPPEQAMGHPVDERADVYSIGAVLYHVLSGQPPYDGKSVGEVLKKLVSEPPPPLETLARGVPAELRTITEKAMARNRDRRYPTARELAAELRRFSTGQMVSSQPASQGGRFRRVFRRYFAVVAVALALMAGLSALGVLRMRKLSGARDEAVSKEAEAALRSDRWMLSHLRGVVERDPSEGAAWLKQIAKDSPLFGHVRTLAADARAKGVAKVIRGQVGPVMSIAFSPDGQWFLSAGGDGVVRVWNSATAEARAQLQHGGDLSAAYFSADSREVVSFGPESGVRIWELPSGSGDKAVEKQKFLGAIRLNWSRLTRDGKSLLTLASGEGLKIWDRATGKDRLLVPIKGHARGIALSPEGNTIGFCADDDALLWDLGTSSRRNLPARESPCTAVSFSPDGKTLALGAEDGFLRFYNAEDGKRALKAEVHRGEVRRMVFLRGGDRLVTAGADGTVRITDAETGESKLLGRDEGMVNSLARSAGADLFATANGENTPKLWHPSAGVFKLLVGFTDGVTHVAFSPDGKKLAAAGRGSSLRIWQMDQISDRIVSHLGSPLSLIRVLPDGTHAAVAGEQGRVWLVRLNDGESKELGSHSGKVNDLAVSADGRSIASAGDDGTVRLFSVGGPQGSERVLKRHQGPVLLLSWLTGDKLVSAGSDKKLMLWSSASEAPDAVLDLGAVPRAMIPVAGGAQAAIGDENGTVYLFVLESKTLRVLGRHADSVVSIDFSPQKNRLISGSRDRSVRLWNWEGGADGTIDTGSPAITKVLFGGQGAWIAALGAEPDVRLWDAAGRVKAVLQGGRGPVEALATSPEGKRLLWANGDSSMQLADIEHKEQRALLGHTGKVRDMRFAPDGKSLLSVSADGSVRLWMDDLPYDEPSLREALNALSSESISIDNFMNTVGVEAAAVPSKP